MSETWSLVRHTSPHLGFSVHVNLPDGGQLDQIASVCCPGNPEFTEKLAVLIAAAPKLLKAIEDLFEHCAMIHKHWGEGSNAIAAKAAIAAAKAAIAKAKGTQ